MCFIGFGKQTDDTAPVTEARYYRFLDSDEEICEVCGKPHARSEMEHIGFDDSEDALSLYRCRACD